MIHNIVVDVLLTFIFEILQAFTYDGQIVEFLVQKTENTQNIFVLEQNSINLLLSRFLFLFRFFFLTTNNQV